MRVDNEIGGKTARGATAPAGRGRCSKVVVAMVCAGAALLAVPTAGHALTISSNLYCSAGANPATNSDTSSQTLKISDVSLTIGSTAYAASDCYGRYQTGPNNPATETSAINDIYKGSGSTFLYLDSSGSSASSTGLGGGLTFTVTAPGTTSGSWAVSWADSSMTPPNLPVIVDFVVELNGGNYDAAYLLPSITLPVSPSSGSGSFTIDFFNSSDKNYPNLSHLLLAGRVVGTPESVPEPATLAVLGGGLCALGFLRRRKAA